jgi:hypothetical protein
MEAANLSKLGLKQIFQNVQQSFFSSYLQYVIANMNYWRVHL